MSPISLVALGTADRTLLKDVRAPLSDVFGVPVDIVEDGVDLGLFLDPGRLQYNSTEILRYLVRRVDERERMTVPQGNSAVKTLAIIPEDLFIPILTFVFGEAQLGGAAAVVSYFRLLNERYGLPPDRALLTQRLCKEAIHELGHAYGLVHCSSQECVMHASTYVEDIDLKGSTLCPTCSSHIARRA